MRRIIAVLAGAALTFGLLGADPASAGVERYQFTDVVLDITHVNGKTENAHTYELRYNPCTSEWIEVEAWGPRWGDETVDLDTILVDGTAVTFTTTYDDPDAGGYSYTATIDTAGGTLTLVDVNSESGILTLAGTGGITQTSYNHGEYVAESIDEYGPDAHSCIGKPFVSKS